MTQGDRARPTEEGMLLIHRLAEQKALSMFADKMASAGVGFNQIAKEVFFFMPKQLMDVYADVWYTGLAGKDDGIGGGGVGAGQADIARVGKAATSNRRDMKSGTSFVSAGGAKRKSYKKYWWIADEEALQIKDRFDKRLRGLAREMQQELDDLKWRRSRGEREVVMGKGEMTELAKEETARQRRVRAQCEGCGRLLGAGWKFCSSCAHRVGGE